MNTIDDKLNYLIENGGSGGGLKNARVITNSTGTITIDNDYKAVIWIGVYANSGYNPSVGVTTDIIPIFERTFSGYSGDARTGYCPMKIYINVPKNTVFTLSSNAMGGVALIGIQ